MVENQQIRCRIEALQHCLQQDIKPLQLHRTVGDHKELGQGQLALAEYPEGGGQRLPAVALPDHCGGQGMEAGFRVGPQLLDPRHGHGEGG
ncbi:hypothetical protein D3C76_1418620 [compost metagenome]